jgi:hypothetical protein
MGTIFIHAGMNKTGSTSIQSWIAENAVQLRAAGVEPVIARGDEEGFRVEPWSEGPAKTLAVGQTYFDHTHRLPPREQTAARRAVADGLHEGLAAAAERYGTVLITSEGFSRFFVRREATYLASLDAIAADHDVRVAYYVRPQHGYLEADWRQTGFCTGWSPSHFVRRMSEGLDYWPTLRFAREVAPRVEFDVRPFVRQLLADGDVVSDFVRGFLRMSDAQLGRSIRANAGFSLEFVNLLRTAPPGRFWKSHLGGQRLVRLKTLTGGWEPRARERTAEARRILQQWCHEEFEADNRRLIEERGWDIDFLVPPTADDGRAPMPLEALDRMWEPTASVGELAVFHETLDRMLADYSAIRRRGDAPEWVASTEPLAGKA